MKRIAVLPLLAAGIAAVLPAGKLSATPAPDAPLVAHEWGTFTALQDDDGTALGAINADDEPVPEFVCSVGGFRTASSRNELTSRLSGGKGVSACHPDVTMRLETPVIYFYPPDKTMAAPVNVRVTFHGGWLTEFYPRAQADAPGLLPVSSAYPPITAASTGSLAWNDVKFAATGKLVATDDPVWTAPREVPNAAVVSVPAGTDDPPSASQPEKFLFYRGVGHLNAPLRVVRDKDTDLLSLFAGGGTLNARDLRVPAAWLVEIRPEDGFCAFRPVPGALTLSSPASQTLATLPASFSAQEFGAGQLEELRLAMHAALITEGLFPAEATAMLKTWELSYFKSPGRRLFYVTPRAWTEQVLPLEIDGARITRAMIGRIELITPAQRTLLARIAAGPCPDMGAFMQEYYRGLNASVEAWQQHPEPGGAWKRPALLDMKIAVPEIYQDYLSLGRFRDALVLREEQVRPTPALTAFITGNELRPR